MRTVGTKLTVDAGQARRELKDTAREGGRTSDAIAGIGKTAGTALPAAARSVKSFEDELTDLAREGKLSAGAIADIGRTAKGAFPVAERAVERLNDEIAETAREIQRLDREFRKTGDLSLFGDLEEQLVKLKTKLKAKDFFDRRFTTEAGTELAEGIGVQLMAKIGPVLARMPLRMGALGPAGAGVGAVLVAGLASTVSAALAGAVVGGAGVGGIAGGLALAGRDPRVRSEAKVLGEEIINMLEDSAQGAFVPVARQQIAALRKDVQTFDPLLRAIFAKAAQLVDPLRRGAVGFGQEVLRGIVTLVDRARPVIDVISKRLPEIGRAISGALEDISDDSQSAAAGVDTILAGLIAIIRVSGAVIGFFVDLFQVTVRVADAALTVTEALTGWNPLLNAVGLDDRLAQSREHLEGLKRTLNDTGAAAADQKAPINELGDEIGRTAEETEALKTAFDNLFGITMDLDQATIAYKQGVVDLKEELLDGRRTLDTNTQAGRDNMSAVLGQLESIKRLRDARIAETGDVDKANRAYRRQIDALRNTMLQMGYTRAEVDKLLGKYRQIPSKIDTKTTVVGGPAARSEAQRIEDKLQRLERTYRPRVVVSYDNLLPSFASEYRSRRWGGIVEHAAVGTLREAQIAAPAGRMYGWAEPQTGGEAFIPRFGDINRSRGIWDYVGRNWLGMGGAGGGRQMVTLRLIQQAPDGRVLREQLIDLASRLNVPPVQLWPAS